ncbi:MAG TPA: hypothetical protein VIX12_05350 [Candidatus Binataceae bacterium]
MFQTCLGFVRGAAVAALLLTVGLSGCSAMKANHVDCNVVRLQAQSGRTSAEIASSIGSSEADVETCHATGAIPSSMESGTPPSGAESGAAAGAADSGAAPAGDTSATPAAPSGGDSSAAPAAGDTGGAPSGGGGKPPM